MEYQKRVSVGVFFRKGEDMKDGDILEIADEGRQIEGQYGTQDVFLLRKSDGTEGNVSFNTTTINNLIDGYGGESAAWVGKTIKISVVKMSVQGKIRPVYFYLHPDSVLDEATGEFYISNTSESKPEDTEGGEGISF